MDDEQKHKEKEDTQPQYSQKELDACVKQRDEYLDGWKRARAEFLNYKKNEMERISTLVQYSQEEMLLKLLPIVDHFEMAEKHLTQDLKNHQWMEGFSQIKAQIAEFLKNQGVEPIKTIGQKFDPNFHEVLGYKEESDKESETIVEEVAKGYLLKGKVLRPAKVKIVK